MPLTDIDSTKITDMQTSTTDYTAGEEPWNKNLDGFEIDTKETENSTYQTDWIKWHGLYRNIAEAASTIDVHCRWVIGKKLKMSKQTEKIVSRIRGNGIDTFRKILMNMKRTSKICGDSYAEIIRDKAGRLINLKILDPGTIRIDASNLGIIDSYNQVAQKQGANDSVNKTEKNKILNSWKPSEIFHVANNRIADEIHGIPETEKLQKIIKMRHQSMSDVSVIYHRYGKPTFFYEVDTDDEGEVGRVQVKIDNAIKNFENVITPKGTLTDIKRTSTPQYSSIDPLPWLIYLRSYFTESSGVPDLIRGKSDEVSLAAGKLNVLGYKEKVIFEQLDFSEEIQAQLSLKIGFEEPPQIDIEIARELGTNASEKAKEDAKRGKK